MTARAREILEARKLEPLDLDRELAVSRRDAVHFQREHLASERHHVVARVPELEREEVGVLRVRRVHADACERDAPEKNALLARDGKKEEERGRAGEKKGQHAGAAGEPRSRRAGSASVWR